MSFISNVISLVSSLICSFVNSSAIC
jgi:hypothetical protein